jgi:uncharacterized membrane-anchored protein
MNTDPSVALSKVPVVTMGFWLIKIFATTLGETAGDTVTMSWDLGYLLGTLIFTALFAVSVWIQVKARQFHPSIYWFTIITTTTVGTTLADFADRSLGIGYTGGTTLLLALLLITLGVWFRTLGSLSVERIHSTSSEFFYWLTILFSQTLGTALGDWVADTEGLGYSGAAILFSTLLAICYGLHRLTPTSKTGLFWAAFILTRPLGAVLGDFLDKPIANGGLELSRLMATISLLVAMLIAVLWVHRHDYWPKPMSEPMKSD